MPDNPSNDDAFQELVGKCQICVNHVAEAIFVFTDPIQEWDKWPRMPKIDRDREQQQIKEVAKESLARIRTTVDEAVEFERKHAEWCLQPGDHSSEPFSESREERLIEPFETVRKLREMSACDAPHRIRQEFREGRADYELRRKNLKASANIANTSKLFSEGFPDKPDLQDLAAEIDKEKSKAEGEQRSKSEIAREFTHNMKNSERRARSLLAELRRRDRKARARIIPIDANISCSREHRTGIHLATRAASAFNPVEDNKRVPDWSHTHEHDYLSR